MVYLAFDRARLDRLGQQPVHFRRFLGSQILNHTEVKLIGDWIRFHQNLLHRINSDPAFYQ